MIPTQLAVAYATLTHNLSALKSRVDSILSAFAEEQDGLYSSRIKLIESILDKAVLGDYKKLTDVEDLFAATLILPAAPIGDSLVQLTESLAVNFDIIETRTSRTRKPSEFIYDDLHYVLRIKDSPLVVNKILLTLSFELQVKSYLQHGWAKATHRTVYKSDTESWRASRVAAQTRAAVEMIEAALSAGEDLLPDEAEQANAAIDTRVVVMGHLLEWWTGQFPDNRRRLGVFVVQYLNIAGATVEDFGQLLHSDRGQELRSARSITIQQAILIILLEEYYDIIVGKLGSHRAKYLVITSEMEDLSPKCREVPAEIRFEITDE